MKKIALMFVCIMSLFVTGCKESHSIVNNVDEREANEIVVFLASKGIEAQKVEAPATEGAGGVAVVVWNIYVSPERSVEAMSLLGQNGLPRRKGTSILDLFAKSGLMTSDKEETIRYQAGLEESLRNIIRKMDGILDADVQISFPTTESLLPGTETVKLKAAVYVKHQGAFDDPNNHLETKIKRLVAGSIDGLNFEDVSVVSDRARLSDIQIFAGKGSPSSVKEYVNIWSVIMTKASAARFRIIFFSLFGIVFLLTGAIGWLLYKFYPQLLGTKKEKKAEETPAETPPEEPK
jgi:type III secretion protein J